MAEKNFIEMALLSSEISNKDKEIKELKETIDNFIIYCFTLIFITMFLMMYILQCCFNINMIY